MAWSEAWLSCGPRPIYTSIFGPGSPSGKHTVFRVYTGDGPGIPPGLTASLCRINGQFYMIYQDTVITAMLSDTPDGSGGLTCVRCARGCGLAGAG